MMMSVGLLAAPEAYFTVTLVTGTAFDVFSIIDRLEKSGATRRPYSQLVGIAQLVLDTG